MYNKSITKRPPFVNNDDIKIYILLIIRLYLLTNGRNLFIIYRPKVQIKKARRIYKCFIALLK